jgi:uncharacterized membrane protein YdfJ with MMPL/SSD domain
MTSTRRLIGAAGRWSATHPWTAILAWLGCVVLLLVTAAWSEQTRCPPRKRGRDRPGRLFLTFATMSMVQLKEMGVGLAVAVLLDATIVRACLLPATMTLLGPRN